MIKTASLFFNTFCNLKSDEILSANFISRTFAARFGTKAHPGDSVNDQVYFKRDIPAKTISPVKINLNHLQVGKYQIQVYKTGYKTNDAYASFIGLKSPSQLTREQVALIKSRNDNPVISTVLVEVKADGKLEKEFLMRQNDVLLLSVKKM